MLGSNKPFKVGIIGCGRMGTGIARKLAPQQQIFLYDRNPEKVKEIAFEIGAKVVDSPEELVNNADIVILAIKPQDLGSLSTLLHGKLHHAQLLVSILAGTSMAKLKHSFGTVPILRMMPNIALLYGQGVIGLADQDQLTKEIKKNVTEIFSCLGNLHWMPENKIDALTALAASGQAYAYVIIESIVEAGISMGFHPEEAMELVLEMFSGSMTMLKETKKHPSELKWAVTSPSGTTIEGLKVMERRGVRGGIIDSFLAAYDRARELAHHS